MFLYVILFVVSTALLIWGMDYARKRELFAGFILALLGELFGTMSLLGILDGRLRAFSIAEIGLMALAALACTFVVGFFPKRSRV